MKSKHQRIRKTILFIMFFSLPIIMNVFSPVVIIISGLKGVIGITFYAWTIMFITSFFIGRSFCAYICPYAGLQMSVYEMNKKELIKSKAMLPIRLSIGIVWLGMIIYFYAKSGGTMQEILFRMESGASIDDIDGIIRYYMIIGGALLFILLLGKRAFCKYLCPMSILNSIGSFIKNKLNLPSLRLEANNDCINCKKCNNSCPMSLDVNKMVVENNMDNVDCILCGQCVEECPKNVLHRTFSKKEDT